MPYQQTTRRLIVARLVVIAVFSLFLVRLIDLQIVRGAQFQELANDNRLFRWRVPPERGVILDRYGQPLVLNNRQYQIKDNTQALYAPLLKIDENQALAWMATASAQVEFELYRSYPWSSALAHVLGFVGPVTVTDLETDDQLRSSDQVGKSGLEKVWDDLLQGRAGFNEFEINALGQRQRIIFAQPARPGQVISSSLDPYLSRVAELAMRGQPGAVVIEDAQTGQILSLISSPGFDPNLLTLPHDSGDQEHQQAIETLFNDASRRLFNRAVSGAYPPGSIFKLVTALAGLESGDIDEQTTVVDEGVLNVGEFSFSNWLYSSLGRTDGPIQLVRAITRSNDIYFYKAAEWTGPDTIAQMAQRLGLNQATGVEIGGEATGLIPNPAWKEETQGERWYLGNTYHLGIGQGDVLVTPIQVAQLTQTIINGGDLCRPSLLLKTDASHCFSLNLDPNHLELVRRGMLGACSAGGTASLFFEFNPPIESGSALDQNSLTALDKGGVACKTGTAEFGPANEKGARKTHAWFTMASSLSLDRIDQTPRSTASALDLSQTPKPVSDGLSKDQAQIKQELLDLRQDWLGRITSKNLPKKIVITVLVESTDQAPYKEGSREAAQVARTIWDWILTGRGSW
ncbi:hypothetical protein KKF92_01630 [Patescibacteria group bacterium]|nr:hypothetical protein [Patescibacteria group bacterium]